MQSEPKSSQASVHRRASSASNPNMEEGVGRTELLMVEGQ